MAMTRRDFTAGAAAVAASSVTQAGTGTVFTLPGE